MSCRIGVVIGRFQPLTAQQFETVIVPAVEESDVVLVILGSSGKPRTPKDPFDAETRSDMITESIFNNLEKKAKYLIENERLVYATNRDYLYDNDAWIRDIQKALRGVREHLGLPAEETEVTLYGAALKGDKKFYNLFPRWNAKILPLDGGELSDEWVRNEILSEGKRIYDLEDGPIFKMDSWREEVMPGTINIIENWLESEAESLCEEDIYIKNYIKNTQNGRYPIIFQTVDNVVLYKGNILLVERGARPGKGQLALPGGFLKHDLSLIDGALKELREETRLRASMGWYVNDERFSHPERSLRGRTITQCFLWEIPDWKEIPVVKGSSDAKRAQWYELDDILENRIGEIFEDHLDIIEVMLSKMQNSKYN